MAEDPCPACVVGWHHECLTLLIGADETVGAFFVCCCQNQDKVKISPTEGPFQRKLKTDGIKDQTSTGRKRAALIKPISPGDVCEWAGLRFAGGGAVPIIGCRGNDATNIHHGPDKSTLNNSIENLHKICATCHNRWHQVNDPFYPKERPADGAPYLPEMLTAKPHDPETLATDEEYEKNERLYESAGRKPARGHH